MFHMKPHDLYGILLDRLHKNLYGNGSSREDLESKCLQCKQTNKQINKWFPSENAEVQVNQQKKKKPP